MFRAYCKGFTLLELLLVVGLTAAVSIVSFQEQMLRTEQDKARRLGMEIFQYNSAIQNFLAHHSGDANPKLVEGTYTGVNWLKSSSCGGSAAKEWLSCKFLSYSSGKTTFGRLAFTTVIKQDPNAGLTARTVMSKLSLGSNKEERADLAGLAALVASGAYAVSEDGKAVTAQDSTVAFCPDTAGVSPISSVCQGDKGVIVMLSRNLSAADRWLRVDHGNAMAGAIEFRTGDPSPAKQSEIDAIDTVNRQIRNVARIYNLGSGNSNSESDNLYLGKKFGSMAKGMVTLPSDAVVIDADQEVLGKLVVAASIEARGDIGTTGNLRSDGNAMIGKNMTVAGATKSIGDLSTNSNFSVSKNATVSGSITSVGGIKGFNGLDISQDGNFGGRVTAQNINANGELSSNTINIVGGGRFGGDLYVPRVIDANDNGYYLDLNQSSRMNAIDANSIRSNGNIYSDSYLSGKYILPGTITSKDSSCVGIASGSISKTASGEILSCQSGVWKGMTEKKVTQWRSGLCQAPVDSNTTCHLADLTWSCSLAGVSGIGDAEHGYVYADGSGWKLYTWRHGWPGKYYWHCFK